MRLDSLKLTDGEFFGQDLMKILCCKLRSSSSTVTIKYCKVRNATPVERTGNIRCTLRSSGWTSGSHLHIVRKSSQTSAHVRQQHVSILHLIALATPCCHVALQQGEPWNTSPWSTLHAIPSDVLANEEEENMMVEELKTFFTNFGLAALLLLIPFSFQCFHFTFFLFGDLE